jgi:DNA repair protein RecN (Recombination protein N)
MLVSLYIENYALIDSQTIEFNEGFNVITGETGAGKSIIVGALALIMGERASTDLIKSGKQRAILEAVFDIRNKKVPGYEDQEVLVIARELSINGRNLIKINSRTVTQVDLRSVTRYLLDIHGQHQHQLLIDPTNHLEILDLFVASALRQETAAAYTAYAEIKKEYDLLLENQDMRQEEIDFLKFQVEELSAAKPIAGEYTELKEEKSRLDAYTEIADVVQTVRESIALVGDQLHRNKARLNSVAGKDSTLGSLAEQAETLDLSFADFKETLQDYQDKLEYNPNRLNDINERLDAYATLKRKHLKKLVSDEEDVGILLQNKLNELTQLLNNLENSDDRLADLTKQLKAVETTYLTAAQKLSIERQALAKILEKNIIESLRNLHMKHVQFAVQFTSGPYTAAGIDTCEFLISANAGEPLKPLAKIASGGELSRVMLAIKDILLEKDRISSMVFDEIDTGIGGDTANAIAAKIKSIARKHQVICITHLAQIAAVADYHLNVRKVVQQDATKVLVARLSNDEREQEIARMLSGKITETTKAHAKELLKA